jgi:hypothetical protein
MHPACFDCKHEVSGCCQQLNSHHRWRLPVSLLLPNPCHPSAALQSEYGDIYKATLVYEGETVTELRVKYFDSLPPCTSLAVLKTGFLFTASETGNHALYQFVVRGGGGVLPGMRFPQ